MLWIYFKSKPPIRRESMLSSFTGQLLVALYDDVIKWKHFPRNWPFVRWIHRSPVNSPPKGQWRGTLMCSLICVWINGWVNNREAGDLRRYRAHMTSPQWFLYSKKPKRKEADHVHQLQVVYNGRSGTEDNCTDVGEWTIRRSRVGWRQITNIVAALNSLPI